MRILANLSNVNDLFERCTADYHFEEGGQLKTCAMPAWRCKACGFVSLFGVAGLPFPHDCNRALHGQAEVSVTGAAEVTQSFQA